jgi:hypothetical protein
MAWFKALSGRKSVLFLGGALLAAGSLFAIACGTDNGTADDSPLPTPDGSRTDGRANDGGTGEPGDGSTATTDGSAEGADCGTAPKLRGNATSFYCAFARDAGPDGGNPNFCNNDQTCCSGGCLARDGAGKCTSFGDSYCIKSNDKGASLSGANYGASGQKACGASKDWVPGDRDASTSSTWECADKNQCGANEVCCLFTGPQYNGTTDRVNIGTNLDTAIPKTCGALQAFKQGGSRCATTCTANTEIRLCSTSDNNCGANQKCTPFEALNRDLAYCK